VPVTANRGEWAELYALVKLLVDNSVPALDRNLKALPGKFFNFIEVLRIENGSPLRFVPYDSLYDEKGSITLPARDELESIAKALLSEIKSSKGRSFESYYGMKLMKFLTIRSIKASSSEKVDLYARLSGLMGSDDSELGFSIKSQIGGKSTLLNASSHTRVIYSVVGGSVDISEVNEICTRSKIKDRVKAIYDSGAELIFESISSETFSNNLDLVESSLRHNLAAMLLASYRTDSRNVLDTIKAVSDASDDPLHSRKLIYQIKNFLRAIALGMIPGTDWSGELIAYGGYLIVQDDGSIGCFHLQKDDEFKNYLIENTKFDTPDSRTDFGKVYVTNSGLKFSLNLQIRFL
jgi:type II restriction enzyme